MQKPKLLIAAVICKPFDFEELVETIRRVVRAWRANHSSPPPLPGGSMRSERSGEKSRQSSPSSPQGTGSRTPTL